MRLKSRGRSKGYKNIARQKKSDKKRGSERNRNGRSEKTEN